MKKRKPLSLDAKRSGWVGCNILFDHIPSQGRIGVVLNGIAVKKEQVLERVKYSEYLNTENVESRGWLFDVLNCVNNIHKQTFVLEEVYAFESALSNKHPLNRNIRPKIRQQLQVLRDMGMIEFIERGVYRKVVL